MYFYIPVVHDHLFIIYIYFIGDTVPAAPRLKRLTTADSGGEGRARHKVIIASLSSSAGLRCVVIYLSTVRGPPCTYLHICSIEVDPIARFCFPLQYAAT